MAWLRLPPSCAPSSNQANHHPAASLPRILGFTHLHLAPVSATAICNAPHLRHLARAGTESTPRLDQRPRPYFLCSSASGASNHVGRGSRTPERRQKKNSHCAALGTKSHSNPSLHTPPTPNPWLVHLVAPSIQTTRSARGHCVRRRSNRNTRSCKVPYKGARYLESYTSNGAFFSPRLCFLHIHRISLVRSSISI